MKTVIELLKRNSVLSVFIGIAFILGILAYPEVFKTLYETGQDLGRNIFNGFF